MYLASLNIVNNNDEKYFPTWEGGIDYKKNDLICTFERNYHILIKHVLIKQNIMI